MFFFFNQQRSEIELSVNKFSLQYDKLLMKIVYASFICYTNNVNGLPKLKQFP